MTAAAAATIAEAARVGALLVREVAVQRAIAEGDEFRRQLHRGAL